MTLTQESTMQALKLNAAGQLETVEVKGIPHIFCSGVKPLRCNGKLVLEIVDIGENDYVGRYGCSCFGWTNGNETVGTANTPVGSIREWCRLTGQQFDYVVSEVLFKSDCDLPSEFKRAVWN